MLARKHTLNIVAGLMAIAVCLCLCAVIFSDSIAAAIGGGGIAMDYETALFQTESPITINLLMEESEWEEMLENAISEEYYRCDVEINGTTFYHVGIRPKGNTSLSSIVSDPTTDRYSFKLEFDRYVEGQTCFGLDKLVLNNNYADATSMKEALVYDLFASLGADASLCNYAEISVNGEYRGVYLALEAVEDSFLLRNYGVANGALYKPEGTGMGGGSMNGGGADLNYSDDALDSYETIWEGAVTTVSSSDRQRVVAALKQIAEGTNLGDVMDIDNLLRYLAVHVFSVNEDSLSGSMAHNYYLYESGGRLNLLPWDYNLAFGGMGMGSDATSIVNDAIDDAFSITDFFDTLLADETYHSQYYACLRRVVEYVENGAFDAFYTRVRNQLDPLIETDPTAFYTYDEYLTAVDTLYQVVKLRAQSIAGQLDGSIPSTSAQQRTADTLVDASSLSVSVMGTMNMGGGGRQDATFAFGEQRRDTSDSRSEQTPPEDTDLPENADELPDGFDPTQNSGEMPDGFESPQKDGEIPEDFESHPFSGEMSEKSDFSQFGGGKASGGGFRGEMGGAGNAAAYEQPLILCAISLGVLIAALIFALCFRRRARKQ